MTRPRLRPHRSRPLASGELASRVAARRRRRVRRPLPPISVIPTLVTLGNLVAGFAAIHYAALPMDAAGPFGLSALAAAGWLVFLGMFFDAVDGSVARLTRSTSDLGAQLDALSDLVTFGVAPAFMMLRLASHTLVADASGPIIGPEADTALSKALWGVAAVYVCCTALRLARFNVETPSAAIEDHLVFRGLPSPGAGGAVASLVVLHQHLRGVLDTPVGGSLLDRGSALLIPLVALACAAGMVSSLPYVHVINRYVGGRRSFGYVVRLVIPLMLAVWWLQETLAVAFTAYALSAPVRAGLGELRRRSRLRAAAATSPSDDEDASTG